MVNSERLVGADPGGSLGVLGKYRLIAKLGQGGMAGVFLAASRGPLSTSKLCVVKRLHSNFAEDEAHIAMFMDEAKLAMRLNHPNIVQTYEVCDEDGTLFLVMEYLEGQPLNRLIRSAQNAEPGASRFTRGLWVQILAEMLSGLHHAHELCDYDGSPLGIVHRDVSPHNVFITYDGVVKVVDFGVAKAKLNTSHTATGMFKGKLAYTAPEQVRGSRELDRRADVFAAGIILWELLAGRRLYGGDHTKTLRALMYDEVPRLTTIIPDVPPELDSIAARALAREPEQRFSTALEMRRALERWLRVSGEAIGEEELGARLQELFAERRAAMRKQIKAYLDRKASYEDDDTPRTSRTSSVEMTSGQPSSLSTLPTLDDGSGSNSVIRGKTPAKRSSSTRAGVPRAAKGRWRMHALAGLVVVTLGAAGIGMGFLAKPRPPPSSLAKLPLFTAPQVSTPPEPARAPVEAAKIVAPSPIVTADPPVAATTGGHVFGRGMAKTTGAVTSSTSSGAPEAAPAPIEPPTTKPAIRVLNDDDKKKLKVDVIR